MTDTLISLISILVGIIGANITGYIFKIYSLGIIGNTIAGVFGSIFLLKSLGSLGFDPKSIIQFGDVHIGLFALNLFVSFIGGAIAVVLIRKIKTKMNH
ncbi:hypothetical protein [Flavivirga spongiicola]|uniref:GlsB/YeaQ/YmgE family stress response membrane protein n=1 Tax=Flavivirga spongiicola TaxID=421621 RepID=A0ABU7XM17_9FLAO|nr:hypothetical protein [Flavivirga sp. MEBiC05379]MDO5981459.1 hypothetical protein [Flavivirga sp. MEBiC05379]MDO5981900.1 hypothetical protein [Flavivirga sp. MEBiC05379]